MGTISEKEFEEYFRSIGGLVNGYYPDRPAITSRWFFSVSKGWLGLIRDLIDELIQAGWDKHILQVKEKFGGLRFYPGGCTDEQWSIIGRYEEKSYGVCEYCGSKDDVKQTDGWVYTMCKKCLNEKDKGN